MAATSTIHSFLMKGTGTPLTYSKLIDIKDYPDMFGDPNQLQATTQSDTQHWYVPGVQDNSGMLNFTCNYDATDFAAIQALEGTESDFALWFGVDANGDPDGHNGKYAFKGYPYAKLVGKGVDEVREMTVGIVPTTGVTFSVS